jgi:NAD(P)H-hydrate epimerase
MRAIDAAAMETLGIPRLLLMDHAGLALARAVRTLAPNGSAAIAVCCGIGFNGGDGLAAARHLHEWGYPVRVLVAGPLDRLREEPAVYARILRGLGLELRECATTKEAAALGPWLADSGVIIDALLGIGAQGTVREPAASLITRMNGAGKPIVSADIPSGLDGDSGRAQGAAVRAAVTVAFGLPKRGCLIAEGPAHVGELVIDPITIPQALLVP